MKEINFDNFIIFLDIDGTICSYEDFDKRDKNDNKHIFRSYSVKALNKIIEYYNADLCMISGWNSGFSTEEQYTNFLRGRGIKVNENLTFGIQHNRYEFIIDQIKAGLKYYLIIDDEAYYALEDVFSDKPLIEYKRILKPNRYRCLDKYDFKQVTFNWKLNV
jgi:hypothetical protein